MKIPGAVLSALAIVAAAAQPAFADEAAACVRKPGLVLATISRDGPSREAQSLACVFESPVIRRANGVRNYSPAQACYTPARLVSAMAAVTE